MPSPKLTVAEMRLGRGKLGGRNPVFALGDGGDDFFEAAAVVAWLLARRADPKADLDTFLNMTGEEVIEELDRLAPDDDEPEEVEGDPTPPAP